VGFCQSLVVLHKHLPVGVDVFTVLGYTVVGFAMYYFTYDPWIGKLLYLEDFYVMKEFRGKSMMVCYIK
jgi:hypothetical protein